MGHHQQHVFAQSIPRTISFAVPSAFTVTLLSVRVTALWQWLPQLRGATGPGLHGWLGRSTHLVGGCVHRRANQLGQQHLRGTILAFTFAVSRACTIARACTGLWCCAGARHANAVLQTRSNRRHHTNARLDECAGTHLLVPERNLDHGQ